MDADRPLILASASPRRCRLLEEWRIAFTAEAPDVDELEPSTGDPRAVAAANARRKLDAVRARYPRRRILAADTVVAVPAGSSEQGARLLAKPVDAEAARTMLTMLSGRSHEVHTAVAIQLDDGVFESVETAHVTFGVIAASELEDYLAGDEWRGKAGGYAIQGDARRFVTGVVGEIETVIGLPRRCVEERLAGGRESGCVRP